eukprot:GHVP01058569.1.p1 GENE.GHVP01058569.1~~GHVP01058569.1.p1  ORF type:complete len:120 (+),score=10.90 GHVP01058569.1:228-587(+)
MSKTPSRRMAVIFATATIEVTHLTHGELSSLRSPSTLMDSDTQITLPNNQDTRTRSPAGRQMKKRRTATLVRGCADTVYWDFSRELDILEFKPLDEKEFDGIFYEEGCKSRGRTVSLCV